MTILVDSETHYNYLKTFENIIILKLFSDCGVDVNLHAAKFNLHIANSWGYASGCESLELFEMLAPHLFKDMTILGTEYSNLGLNSDISNDEKTEIIHSFFEECSNLHPEDKFPEKDNYSTDVVFIINGDFSCIKDIRELQKHAYPFEFEFKELYKKVGELHFYERKPSLDKVPNHAITDDGMEFCFYVNDKKDRLLFGYDVYDYGWECYSLASLFCSLYRMMEGEKK